MLAKHLAAYRPSLRRWAHILGVIWLIGAGLLVPVSIKLVEQIHDDAERTYKNEIPALLDRNRNAIKIERLSSFLRRILSTTDPQIERHILLQLQTLAQGFDLDGDMRLSEEAAHAVAGARKIIAIHATLRNSAPAPQSTALQDHLPQVTEAEENARQIGVDAIKGLNVLTDYLTTDAALTADRMAGRIQQNALRIKYGSIAVLAFFLVIGAVFLWIFQRHVLAPIAVAVKGLEAISGSSDNVPVEVPRARFFELDMIGRSVEQYARFAGDLRMANLALHTLSKQDGLTGLVNRRCFDIDLGEACRRTADDAGQFALLLIDIDHFKLLNDRFGHLAGDQCLRQVAMILQSFSSRRGDHAARYGGEEFAIILSDASPDNAHDLAEQLRITIERAQLYVSGARRTIDVTVSIGVATVTPGSSTSPDRVIHAADEALYRAKRSGRNRVCVSDPDETLATASQSAA